jgi:hypothetical protein
MAGLLCGKVSRNMTSDEWKMFVDEELDIEVTCPEKKK